MPEVQIAVTCFQRVNVEWVRVAPPSCPSKLRVVVSSIECDRCSSSQRDALAIAPLERYLQRMIGGRTFADVVLNAGDVGERLRRSRN